MFDSKLGLVIVTVIIALGFFTLMFFGFRKKRKSNPVSFSDIPSSLGEPSSTLSGMYLSSSKTEDKLVRVSAGPLAFRGMAGLSLHNSGILIGIDGAADFWIPITDITEIAHESFTIDRAVEPGGMTVIRWQRGTISSYFRLPVSEDKEISEWFRKAVSAHA